MSRDLKARKQEQVQSLMYSNKGSDMDKFRARSRVQALLAKQLIKKNWCGLFKQLIKTQGHRRLYSLARR